MFDKDLEMAQKLLSEYKKLKLTEPNEYWPNDIIRALNYLNENIFELDTTVKSMKDNCRISQQNISSRFNNYVGKSPIKYLSTHRIKAAKLILRSNEINLSKAKIGFLVGYDKPSTFTKAFQRNK